MCIRDSTRTRTHTHTHLHRVEEIHQLVLLFQDVQETGADVVVTTVDVGVQTSLEQQVDGAHIRILHAAKAPASVPMFCLYLCNCEVQQLWQCSNVLSLCNCEVQQLWQCPNVLSLSV